MLAAGYRAPGTRNVIKPSTDEGIEANDRGVVSQDAHIRGRLVPPQAECLLVPVAGDAGIPGRARRPCPAHQVTEGEQIELRRAHPQLVAARHAGKQPGRIPPEAARIDEPPQPADVRMDLVHGRGRRPVRPQGVDDAAASY